MKREENSSSQERSNNAAALGLLQWLHLHIILGHRVVHKTGETLTLTQD